jgi:hypothetical protein
MFFGVSSGLMCISIPPPKEIAIGAARYTYARG